MKRRNLDAPFTQRDSDDLVNQFIVAVNKAVENLVTKDDIKNMATKDDIKRLDGKIDDVASDVSDIRRRVIDLETYTVSRSDFDDLKAKVLPS